MKRFVSRLMIAAALVAVPAAAYAADGEDTAPHTNAPPNGAAFGGGEGHGHGAHGGGEAAEGEGEHGEEHGPGAFNLADFSNKKQPPYLAALINFGLLVAMYWYFGKKPVADALKSRRETVAKEIADASRMLEEAKARAEKYQSKLASLQGDVDDTKRAGEDAGKADRERIVKEAHEKAARMEKEAAFILEQEVRQMRVDLVKETVEEAIAAAEKLVASKITMADQERLAEEYLRDLAARTNGKSFAAAGGNHGATGAGAPPRTTAAGGPTGGVSSYQPSGGET